jgi:hypothetical protein
VTGAESLRGKGPPPRHRAVFLAGWILLWSVPALAGREVGATLGFDTNVNRAVDGAQSDVQLGGYAAFLVAPDGESRYDWTAAATVEGAASLEVNDPHSLRSRSNRDSSSFHGGGSRWPPLHFSREKP